MRSMPLPNLLIWISGILLLGFIAIMGIRRRLYREFPIFSTYVLFHLLHATLALWVYYRLSSEVYYFFHWGGEAFDGLLSLALIYEIFSQALSPYPGIRRTGLRLYFIASLVLTLGAMWIAVSDPHSIYQRLNSAVISMDRSFEFMQVGLLFLLFVFHHLLGLSWRHYLFGIVLGLSISTTISVLSTAARLQIGMSWSNIFVLLAPLSYDLGLVVWSYYTATSESKVHVTEVPYSAHLTRWNHALEEILPRQE